MTSIMFDTVGSLSEVATTLVVEELWLLFVLGALVCLQLFIRIILQTHQVKAHPPLAALHSPKILQ